MQEKSRPGDNDYAPSVTTIIAVHNEQAKIENRVKNLLACDYPREQYEIIIASDGSTDATVAAAARFGGPVIVLDCKKNRGRASVHNDAVEAARGEIIIFSDADTFFSLDFIKQIVDKFRNSTIGCVTSNLTYKTQGTAISDAEGIYFQLEKKMRSLESKIGILATASGPAMAIRKSLWIKLTPIDDCDFTTPLDVILQGYKVVYAPDAIAFDIPPSSLKGEFKARVRMTSKNLIGTLRRWSFAGWFKHPAISWGLLSHKILRWLTFYFLLIAFFSDLALLDYGALYQVLFAGQVVFYLLAIVGYVGESFHKRIPIASTIFSFCVAMIGMGFGVVKGILGKAPAAYRMEE
jgi:cellulose synthase/poly-beta-1,6-N-acetylglucosamine synthase-like glycosyltransferase